MKIRDYVDVLPQPTVVRLERLEAPESQWISDAFFVTEDTAAHLSALRVLLSKDTGSGVFLIGHYGSGKSHFLAFVTQQIRSKAFAGRNPDVQPISLLNYKAAQPLESIVESELNVVDSADDRRTVWEAVARKHPSGLLLVLDEVSEFLRSKPSPQSFNEDLRFLQFLGEWAQSHPLWIVAAMQEQIEHTGEIEYDLFRKIKDRYPIRLLLTPAHIRDLIAKRILRKKPNYSAAVDRLVRDLQKVYARNGSTFAQLYDIYPLHPATLDLLEEVRDRFSQARGIIDYTLTQLLGNPARGISPLLDEPWGRLLTPDSIVDHFSDLFEVQPEFLLIAQKVLPYFRDQMPVLFETKARQELGWRLLKLLILVHLSPRRETLDADEAAQWLLLKVSSIDPEKNREIIRKTLDTFARNASYVKQDSGGFRLDLEDDSKEYFDQLLLRTIAEIRTHGDGAFEAILASLDESDFNPFSMPRDRWHARNVHWHFHDREIRVYFGAGAAPSGTSALSLQIGLPWGPPADTACFKILPKRIDLTSDLLELAALHYLKDRPLATRVLSRVQERISARSSIFASQVRAAYLEATVFNPAGEQMTPPLPPLHGGFGGWMNAYGEWLLRQVYPLFERFAPGFGPLPNETYRQFMKFVSERDLGASDAPDGVKLIREAYLVPMGLLQRRGTEYIVNPKLETNDLVRLLSPILQHHPSPARVYEHLGAPVYGLVSDQIHLLLLVLLIQGEIDIVKGERSYRESYETIISPLQYEKILPGRALSLNQLRTLQTLCEGFRIALPKQWSVLAQKRAVEQLRKYGRTQRDQLSAFLTKLREYGDAAEVVAQCEDLIGKWLALEKGDHELQGFQHLEIAIGSAQRFVNDSNELATLPQRFERLLRETHRLRHLLSDPVLRSCDDPDLATRLENLPPVPPLSEPETVETWLVSANALYQQYQSWYRNRHEEWRRATSSHPISSLRFPAIARSRHLVAGELIHEIETLLAKARSQQCAGLTGLDFQPLCRCGFDGRESPLNETLRRFEAAHERLQNELVLFFQQDRVKSMVEEWAKQGIEVSTETMSYLEGRRKYPEVENLQLFDQHLSGLELAKPIHTQTLLDFIGERTWEKSALLKALEQFFNRAGSRLVFRREADAPKKDLIAWCYQQALRHGLALPPFFSRQEQAVAAQLIDGQWIAPSSLRRLEQMNLGEEATARVLEMILTGTIRLPDLANGDSRAVSAALEMLKPVAPMTVPELAATISRVWPEHDRFLKLRPEHWLGMVDRLAKVELSVLPEPLEAKLKRHLEAQWIVVDCLGLPLLECVRAALHQSLAGRQLESTEFALVSPSTSTESFYVSLIEQEFRKPFHKIDAVDDLIHQRDLNFDDLARLARAELEIAFKKLAPRLETGKPILIFGDHGFRIAPDGRGFVHGGPSTLERITVVLRLD